jgi:glycosyltransferase involved in cell wall biosynthesis
VREAVSDGVEGFVVPPREPDAIARALERLWREPALRTEMGQAGRERVVAEFGLERQVRSYMGLYDELTGARAG